MSLLNINIINVNIYFLIDFISWNLLILIFLDILRFTFYTTLRLSLIDLLIFCEISSF